METVNLVLYVVKVSMILGIFYGVYYLLLRDRSNHGLNRFYLLFTLILALVIPFVENPFPDQANVIMEQETFGWIAEPVVKFQKPEQDVVSEKEDLNAWKVAKWVYLIIVFAFIGRSIFHLVILHQLKKRSVYVKENRFRLYKTAHSRPFSFLSNVFIPESLFGTEVFDQIIAHECAHVRQFHSVDRLLVDFYVALLWFNPFIYLYRRALIEVHEYQADRAVIETYLDPVRYQEMLYSQLSLSGYSGLVSHFNFSTIKKRIVMMNKINKKQSGWYYLLTAPVVLSVVFAFSSKEVKFHMDWVEGEISVMMAPEIPQLEVPDPVPSILPLKLDEENIRLSSSFGMRWDPVHKKNRVPRGIDLAHIPQNSYVVATKLVFWIGNERFLPILLFFTLPFKKVDWKYGFVATTKALHA